MDHNSKKGVESYIVRVYRHTEGLPGDMAGLVEKVGASDKKPFKNKEELWQILQDTPKRKNK